MLKALGEDVFHLQDMFPASTPDVEWMPRVGELRMILVTTDLAILASQTECTIFKQSNLTAFFLPKNFQKEKRIWEQALSLIKAWPNIREAAANSRQGTCYDVQQNGTVKVHKF